MTRAAAYMQALRALAEKNSRVKRESVRAKLVEARNFLIDDPVLADDYVNGALALEELRLLSHIFKEYGVHKQYPAFVDRVDELKRKAEAMA